MPPISPVADLLSQMLILSPLILCLFFLFVWPCLAVRRSPQTDLTRIRERVKNEGDVVIEIVREGADWLFLRSGIITLRKYRLVTEQPDGTRTTRIIGVHCTLVRRPDLIIYDNGHRASLWGDGPTSFSGEHLQAPSTPERHGRDARGCWRH